MSPDPRLEAEARELERELARVMRASRTSLGCRLLASHLLVERCRAVLPEQYHAPIRAHAKELFAREVPS